jgi:hypothetical protein
VVVTNAPYSYNFQGGVKPDGTMEKSLAEIYGVDPGDEVRRELGAFLSATYRKTVFSNVDYRTRLDLMSDFERHAENIDIYWTNGVTMSVNKWLKVSYNFDLIYDDDVKIFGDNRNVPAIQMKSILGVGVAVGF